ncbi:MAG TPA: regulatory signaling modulator protein AmpE [Gammaproteobacteria bacterium]|nr:regulatory signaling modulator protein AmpE [Gammaproteobacteria bacterium]
MTFIITLIALVIERFFHWSHLRHWRWFYTFQQWLSHSRIHQFPSWALFLFCVLPLTVLVGIVDYFLSGWFYGILKIVWGVAVLLYCLGPTNLWVAANDQPFARTIFVAANERIFSVVFWFVVLGPMGAVFYRSTALMNPTSPLGLSQLAKTIQQWLDWIPVRLLTFMFALGGHFTRVFSVFKKNALRGPETNEVLLTECGMAALDATSENAEEKDALALLDRVFVMALAILAMVVLIL